MVTTVNLTLSDAALENFRALKKRLGKNQHDTATIVFERLNIEGFE